MQPTLTGERMVNPIARWARAWPLGVHRYLRWLRSAVPTALLGLALLASFHLLFQALNRGQVSFLRGLESVWDRIYRASFLAAEVALGLALLAVFVELQRSLWPRMPGRKLRSRRLAVLAAVALAPFGTWAWIESVSHVRQGREALALCMIMCAAIVVLAGMRFGGSRRRATRLALVAWTAAWVVASAPSLSTNCWGPITPADGTVYSYLRTLPMIVAGGGVLCLALARDRWDVRTGPHVPTAVLALAFGALASIEAITLASAWRLEAGAQDPAQFRWLARAADAVDVAACVAIMGVLLRTRESRPPAATVNGTDRVLLAAACVALLTYTEPHLIVTTVQEDVLPVWRRVAGFRPMVFDDEESPHPILFVRNGYSIALTRSAGGPTRRFDSSGERTISDDERIGSGRSFYSEGPYAFLDERATAGDLWTVVEQARGNSAICFVGLANHLEEAGETVRRRLPLVDAVARSTRERCISTLPEAPTRGDEVPTCVGAATWNSTGRLQTSADCPDPWLRLTPGPPEAPARVLLESIRGHALWIRGPISPDRERGQLRTSDPMRATSSSTWIHAERPAAAWVPLGIGVVAAATRRLRERDRSVGGGSCAKRWASTVAWTIAFATLLVVLPDVQDAYHDLRREVARWFAR